MKFLEKSRPLKHTKYTELITQKKCNTQIFILEKKNQWCIFHEVSDIMDNFFLLK